MHSSFKNTAPIYTLDFKQMLTRWDTWVKVSFYYCEYFELIQSILNSFDYNYDVSVKIIQKYIRQKNIKCQLVIIKSKLFNCFLPNAITSLDYKTITCQCYLVSRGCKVKTNPNT